MRAKTTPSAHEESAARQIDAIIGAAGGWRGARLAQLRAVITQAAAGVVEEVKWKKPSNPQGVPVWSHRGILCVGETLKQAVRLTFPKGARIDDPQALFNARLASTMVRAMDVHESDTVDEAALAALVREAMRLNS
jgi:hypothetical protein